MKPGLEFDSIIKQVSSNGIRESIKPVYNHDGFCLYKGDCLTIMQRIPDNHVDLIFADPPYMLSNDGITCQAGKMVSVNKGKWDKSKGFEIDLAFHEQWISECKRILKPSGTLWISGTQHSIFQCGYLLQKLNYHILNDIAWFKPNAAPNLACTTFAHSHETLLWARKEKKTKHNFNYELMKNGKFPEDKMKAADKQMRSVWSIPTAAQGEKEFGKHPTQKPLALLKRIILASTKDDDLILDPFNGGGTTGIASQLIGNRKYMGIEISEEYIKLTINRLKALKQKPSLFHQGK